MPFSIKWDTLSFSIKYIAIYIFDHVGHMSYLGSLSSNLKKKLAFKFK
jgi:hypothetical protein